MIFTKTAATLIRGAQVLGTMYCAGICTYLIIGLAKSSSWNGRTLAVEIISGAGFLYASFALLLTIFLLQKSFFQFGSILFDLLFCGAFIAVAILLRNIYSRTCSNSPNTVPWMEKGGRHYFVNCELTKGVFIVACILAFLFFLTALISLIAHRKTKKDKAYGPSPSNGYTSGRGKKHNKHDTEAVAGTAAVPVAAALTRPSHDSKYTDATEKTTEGLPGGNTTTGPGREYLAPRATYTGTDRTVSPVPSTQNLRNNNDSNSHAGQYAVAGALAGGATAAHHHHGQNKLQDKNNTYENTSYNNDNLPRHPTPGFRGETVTTPEAARRMGEYTGHHPHLDGAIYNDPNSNNRGTAYSELSSDNNRTTTYSELDNTTTSGSYAGNTRNPNKLYPASNNDQYQHASGLTELDTQNVGNPHYYNSDKRFSEYMSPTLPNTPGNEFEKSEAGYGYANGPGQTGQTGGNQVSRLPELGREEPRRF